MKNQNLENKQNSKSKILRNYDKEPIILYDYEILHNAIIVLIPLLFGASIPTNIQALFDGENINEIILVNSIIIGMILFICIIVFIVNNPKKTQISIKNFTVEFYEKTAFSKKLELKRKIELYKIKENIYRPFTVYSIHNESFKSKLIIFGIAAFGLISGMGILWFIGFLIFGFLGFVLANFILYLIIGKSGDRFFTMFPKIALTEPYFIPYSAGNFLPQYYSLIICNHSKYAEVKEYFLNLHNINIDNVEKIYF